MFHYKGRKNSWRKETRGFSLHTTLLSLNSSGQEVRLSEADVTDPRPHTLHLEDFAPFVSLEICGDAKDERGCPAPAAEQRAKAPLRRPTWFASKGLGGVVTEINPDGVLLGAFWQSSYALHIVEFCDLKEEPRWAGGQKARSPGHQHAEQKQDTKGAGPKEECVRPWVISGSAQCPGEEVHKPPPLARLLGG